MVKLDVKLLRYLTADDIRILTAVEMGQKNHQLVPAPLIAAISSNKCGGVTKTLHQLTRHKLLVYESGKRYQGYRLTYRGYDFLALNVLRHRNSVSHVGNQIGVGKESDVFCASGENDQVYALKLHRLGRICFRKVNDKRDYQKSGNKVHSFLYLSRLAAKREFAFMTALYEKNFPVPKPIDYNRHVVVMELIDGVLLNHLLENHIKDKARLYDKIMDIIIRLANKCGVVHGDLNEFNLLIKTDTEDPVLIDFPQMISIDHKMAQEYFDRDVKCVVDLFKKKFNYVSDYIPTLNINDLKIRADNFIKNYLNENKEEYVDVNVLMRNVSLYDNEKEDDDECDEEDEDECDEEDENDQDYKTNNEGEQEIKENVLKADNDNEAKNVNPINLKTDISEALKLYLKNSDDLKNNLNDCDKESVYTAETSRSNFVPSVAGSTFAPEDIRNKLKKEREIKSKREQIKKSMKKVKGEANIVRRDRNINKELIKEDLGTHLVEPF